MASKMRVVVDPRGESESYEGYSLEWLNDGRVVATEGIQKDRTNMLPHVRFQVEAEMFFLRLQESES